MTARTEAAAREALLSLAAELEAEALTMRRDLSKSALQHAAGMARRAATGAPGAPETVAPVAQDPGSRLDALSAAQDEEFPATWDGGHALVVEFGDEEMLARCQCGTPLGTGRPNEALDKFGLSWERHVMSLWRTP